MVWNLEFFLKHIHERQLLKRWQEIADILPELTKVRIGYDYIEMFLRYTLTSIDQNDKIELEKMLVTSLNKEKGEEIMVSLAQAWKEEGIQAGIKIGEARGEARGEAKGAIKEKIKIAKKMLEEGYDPAFISAITGLDKDFVYND